MKPPKCECHSFPMKHGDRLKNGKFRWRCRIKDAETQRKFRARQVAKGMCIVCMTAPAEGGAGCRSCRNRVLIHSIDKTINKYEHLLSLDKNDPEYIAIVRKEQTLNG